MISKRKKLQIIIVVMLILSLFSLLFENNMINASVVNGFEHSSSYEKFALNLDVRNDNSLLHDFYLTYTPYPSISISSDSELEAFPGAGTSENPYLIDGYNITTTDQFGIYITGVTKHFSIQNCFIKANHFGIFIENIDDGIVTIINNICIDSYYSSITVDSSDNATIVDNTLGNNLYGVGIGLTSCDNSTVVNNTCTNSAYGGIYFNSLEDSVAINNTCNNNGYAGIVLFSCITCKITNNTCINNDEKGIWLDQFSESNTITYTTLKDNGDYGIYLATSSNNNLIHHNTLVNNGIGASQGYDSCTNNYWYNLISEKGNYWDDWSGTGKYAIAGSAGTEDLYPLKKPVDRDNPVISSVIHQPLSPTDLDPININATVTDGSGINHTTFYYRVNGGSWFAINMTNIEGYVYNVTIGPFGANAGIDYCIKAVDDSDDYNEAIDDNQGFYYTFSVVGTVPELSFELTTTIFISVFVTLGIITIKRRKQ